MLITTKDLGTVREKHPDKTIVFCSGVFDVTHAGHAIFLEDCKALGDLLVVCVGEDTLIQRYKGPTRPIMNQHVRSKMIASLKSVDYCFIDNPLPENVTDFLAPLDDTFNALRPTKWVINQDAFDIDKRKALAAKYNIELVVLDRHCPPEFENISTTSIIDRIKKLY